MRVAVSALLASGAALVAAYLSHAQGLDFGPWALHTSVPGDAEAYE